MSAIFQPDTAILNGEEVDIAPLSTIDFYKLATNDSIETQRLLDCCVNDGFFYLDLRGSHPSSKILSDQVSLLDLMKHYFDQLHEVKMEDNLDSMTDGSVSFTCMLYYLKC